jgi:hypothetical protein
LKIIEPVDGVDSTVSIHVSLELLSILTDSGRTNSDTPTRWKAGMNEWTGGCLILLRRNEDSRFEDQHVYMYCVVQES